MFLVTYLCQSAHNGVGCPKEISCSSEVPSVRLVGGDGEGRHVVGAEIGSSYVAGTLTSGQLAFT